MSRFGAGSNPNVYIKFDWRYISLIKSNEIKNSLLYYLGVYKKKFSKKTSIFWPQKMDYESLCFSSEMFKNAEIIPPNTKTILNSLIG